MERNLTENRQKTTGRDKSFSRWSFEIVIVLSIIVHVRLQIIIFSHDTINETFIKWDDTLRGATCGWTNSEAQSGLVLLPVNTRDNTNIIRSNNRQKTKQTSTQIDEESTENRQKKSTKNFRKSTEVSQDGVSKLC